MIHYYLQKGFHPNYLINLSSFEKMFFYASMMLAMEEKEASLGLNS